MTTRTNQAVALGTVAVLFMGAAVILGQYEKSSKSSTQPCGGVIQQKAIGPQNAREANDLRFAGELQAYRDVLNNHLDQSQIRSRIQNLENSFKKN